LLFSKKKKRKKERVSHTSESKSTAWSPNLKGKKYSGKSKPTSRVRRNSEAPKKIRGGRRKKSFPAVRIKRGPVGREDGKTTEGGENTEALQRVPGKGKYRGPPKGAARRKIWGSQNKRSRSVVSGPYQTARKRGGDCPLEKQEGKRGD